MVELLKHKANVNIVNKKKQTPLHIAVGVTSPECIKILLKANADPSMKVLVSNINFTDTIIHDSKILDCPNDKKYYKLIAFQKWVWKWINLVIKLCKLQLTLKYYFQKWVWWKWWSVIKFPRYQLTYYWKPIYEKLLIFQSKWDCIKWLSLIKLCGLQDFDGDTQMHDAIAQKNNESDIVKYLLESPRADFSQTNKGGFNVLHWAAMKNSKLWV